jgi:glutamyl-tRNA reductase
MELFVIGLSHRTAPVAVRERLAIVPAEMESYLKRTAALAGMREVVILSTCNRVEIYGAFSDCDEAVANVRALLAEQLTAGRRPQPENEGEDEKDEMDPTAMLGRHVYARVRREALHHLFRVSASLDSLVIGEPQILGQIKEAYELAARVGTAGPLLGSVFPRAFRVARKVRRDTGIAAQRVSVSSVAVDLARKVWGGFAGRRVLIVGAGKMADLAARVLAREGASLAVTNRTAARAEELARRLGATVEPWADLAGAVVRSDIVISSTGAREPILHKRLLKDLQRTRRNRQLVLIDIAVPRDIEPSVAELDDVYLFDIDDLQKVVADNLDDRRQEGDRAEALVEEELARFIASDRSRAAGPTIAALRARAETVARAEVERVLATFPAADERTTRSFRGLADAIVAKLLHAPCVALKKDASDSDGVNLVEAVHRLFGLPPLQALGGDRGGDREDEPAAGEADRVDDDAAPGRKPKKASST